MNLGLVDASISWQRKENVSFKGNQIKDVNALTTG